MVIWMETWYDMNKLIYLIIMNLFSLQHIKRVKILNYCFIDSFIFFSFYIYTKKNFFLIFKIIIITSSKKQILFKISYRGCTIYSFFSSFPMKNTQSFNYNFSRIHTIIGWQGKHNFFLALKRVAHYFHVLYNNNNFI